MKKGDTVMFTDLTPLYILDKFRGGKYTISFIDESGWMLLKEDSLGYRKERIYPPWLRVVKEA